MNLPRQYQFLGLFFIIISAVVVFIVLTLLSQQAVIAHEPILQIPTSVNPDPNSESIKLLEEELRNAPDQAARDHIEAKLAFLYREATARAYAYQNIPRAPRNENATAQAIQIEEVKETGIIDEPFIILRPDYFKTTNGWQEKIGDSWVHVTAGILTKDPSQGILYIQFYGGPIYIGKFIPMPKKDGIVRIVEAKGYRLALETEGGSKYYFDVPGLSFAGSMDEIVPTITPMGARDNPTETPISPYP